MTVPRIRVVDSQVITRPANTTPYASGDLVANDATAGNVTPFLFSDIVRQVGYKAVIRRAGISVSGIAVTNGTFRMHLFSAEPTVANGDNGALAVATNADKYLGYVEMVLAVSGALGSKGWSVAAAPDLGFKSINARGLWGLLEARAAYVPASGETIQVSLEVE